jgi:Fe2+ or Zn2+ uptake regulation protein
MTRDQVIIPAGSVEKQAEFLREHAPHLVLALMARKPDQYTLTKRQNDLLQFLKEYISKHEFAPSYSEIMEGVGFSSMSGVYQMMKSLEERGVILRARYKARAIKIVGTDL